MSRSNYWLEKFLAIACSIHWLFSLKRQKLVFFSPDEGPFRFVEFFPDPLIGRGMMNLVKVQENAAWPGCQGVGFEIWRSRVQIPLWPLAGFVPGSSWFNSSAALVQSQLVCLLPVGILNLLSLFQLLVSLALKSPSGSGQLSMYVCFPSCLEQRILKKKC